MQQSRTSHCSIGQKNIHKRLKHTSLFNHIEPSFNKKGNLTPNVLMELTVEAYNFLKCNSIHLSGITVSKGKYSYTNIDYHNAVQKFIPKCCRGVDHWYEINLNRMKNNYFLVTVDKSEMTNNTDIKNVIFMTNGLHCEAKGSGKLVLLLARLQKKKKNSFVWTKHHFDKVNKCKRSVITKSNKHHGSTGHYFSFGNKAAYRKCNNSSVSQYAVRNTATFTQECDAVIIEDIMCKELQQGIECLNAIKPSMSIKNSVAPVLKIADKLQSSIGDIKLKATEYSKFGIWKSVFCVNAETEELHNEDDCSYTVITVPKQKAMIKKREYKFSFAFNDAHSIAIRMNEPLTFMFSGKFLMHNQSCNRKEEVGADDFFFNFGTYGNKKLFNHIRCSFARVSNATEK